MSDAVTCSLYRAYDAGGRLLYIGVTSDVRRRFYGHRHESRWWPKMAKRAVREYETRGQAERVEERAIRLLKPMHNWLHNEGNHQAVEPMTDEEITAAIRRLNAE